MEKLDLKKEFKDYFKPSSKEPQLVVVPNWQFLMIDGINAKPESQDFQQAIQLLFSLSYKIKFSYKKLGEVDYKVMPLEGLWWADDINDFVEGKKENWKWTMMIMQPEFITPKDLTNAIDIAHKKDPSLPFEKIRLENFEEGNCVQIMHIGPFSEEHANIMKIHSKIKELNGSFDGKIQKHHEIYLSDFRRTAPEKLRTILRQPFY
jgi:hypothetical protein